MPSSSNVSSLRMGVPLVFVLICAAVVCAVFVAAPCVAQVAGSPAQGLITQAIDESQLTTLKGNTHPLARPEFDLGTAPASLPMQRMLLVLKRSSEQETALDQLLDQQQDKSSPNYHKWLTPVDFGKQFGPTDTDVQTITGWLQSHGFQVGTTKGRTVLEFSGSASQVQEAFHTSIHKYLVNAEQHWANASDPQIPTALTPAIAGVASLNNFSRKAMNIPAGARKRDAKTGKFQTAQPQPEFTFPNGCVEDNLSQQGCANWLAPYDFATIYNETPLWNAGINGTGVTIAIVGETDIQLSDVQAFRSMFGLPANDPVFVPNGPDPGIQGDESEADIDVQWSGAVAPGATIDFVISESTETTSGVDLSAVYIVDQNLAPIMSESYGECELGVGTSGNQFYNALWQQASAQGITVFISAGDAGSAGCDNFDAAPPAPAQYGLQISGYASTPYNVAVGGTDFNDFNNPGTYWSTTNNSGTLQSVLSYIPETTWNDSCTNPIWVTLGWGANAEAVCNNTQLNDVVVVGGSGGASNCTTPNGNAPQNCAGGYARPSWQTGSGSFSPDGKRDIPDVSLFASNGFLGTAYSICEADYPQGGPCPDYVIGFGGTSVSSPAFAGIMALINQKTGQRQGNANYVFYKLAQKSGASCTSAAVEASSCIFNDVTVGTNAGPCAAGSPNCVTSAGDLYGVMSGYNASAGYDLTTGLGTVNAANLVNQWSSITFLPSVTTLSSLVPTTITHGQSVSFTVSVAPQSGTGTPTGVITLEGGGITAGNTLPSISGFTLSNGTVSASTDMLPGGTYQLAAHYAGDANYGPSDSSPISVTVAKENSQPQAFLVTLNSSNQVISSNTNTAVYGSPYILRVNVENSAGQQCAPVAPSGATACPSGTVTMTDNGNALDAGSYTLNSYGYFEDYTVQLPGGTNSVKAAYAGDNSFNAAAVTAPITITPASTTVGTPQAAIISAGQPASISVVVSYPGTGVLPTGTVAFYANGNKLGGTVTYSQSPGFSATILTTANAFPSPGSYAITATYSGDNNYSGSTSPAYNISIKYPSPNVLVTPATQTVSYGSTATITALADSGNKTIYPTGTVAFVDAYTGTTVSGPTACANATDSSGNFGCQVIGKFTVTSSDPMAAIYSGDGNYPEATTDAFITMPDFQVNPQGEPSVTAGQSQNVTIVINSMNGFSGTVSNFGCSGLPAETTCSFSPTQVTVAGGGEASTTLSIATTAIGQARRRASNEPRAAAWKIAAAFILLGACFTWGSRSTREGRAVVSLMLVALFILLPSCGGGSGGGGGGGGTPNPVPVISSLSPTQVAAGSQIQTLNINGSNFLSSSTVTYNGTFHNSLLQSTNELQVALEPRDVASTGQYPVVVTNPSPGGGSSAPMNFAVLTGTPTGSFYFTVTASSGPLTHTTTMVLTVQ